MESYHLSIKVFGKGVNYEIIFKRWNRIWGLRTFWKSIEKNELIVKKIIDCDEDDGKYGYEFRDIGIITMILSEDLDHVLERKFISRKNKEVDIRLRINYKKFVESDENQQFILYVKNIIDSIKVVNGRKKGDFNGEKLIDDILSTLGLSLEKLADELEKINN